MDFVCARLRLLSLLLLLLLAGPATSIDLHLTNITITQASANVVELFQDDTNNNNQCCDCHRFDGIGGISGGGSTSRLLVEYPPDVQSEILDFLFLPNFGASLHMLKVEIGGDAQSTDGSETSHMHSPNDLNLNRGYEWWILKEAKKRNPDILTYGLPWAWPGWITDDKQTGNPFQHIDIATNYTLQWVKGAREVHGIEIDYLGIWNEIGTSREYLLALRKVLDAHGFQNTKIVSNDGQPGDVLPQLVNDTEYLDGIDVLGFHYPHDDDTDSWKIANSLDKPIWAAEESSSYDDLNGASCWARVIASHYILNNMTANIMWNLLGSYAHGTNWYASSMLTAVEPWTGYYEWEQMPVVWATAHYTQFIQPGWYFLPVGQGSGELSIGGYYLTLVSPDLKYFTVIVVKISRDHASCTRPELWNWDTKDELFNITIRLPSLSSQNASVLHAGEATQTWYSNLEQEDVRLFEKLNPRHNSSISMVSTRCTKDGQHSFDISLNVTVGSIFTVSNQPNVGNKGQSKIHAKSDSFFPLPYYDDFNDYECDNCYSKYLSDQMGAFEIQLVDTNHKKGSKGPSDQLRALVQMTPQLPVTWWQQQKDRGPVSIIGMTEWEDIEVKISFLLPDTTTAACVSARTDQFWERGVSFCANSTHWLLMYGGANLSGYDPVSDDAIAYGNVYVIPRIWHTIAISTLNQTVQGHIDGVLLIDTTIRVGDSGFAALGASGFAPVQYGYISVKPIGAEWSRPQPSKAINVSSDWSLSVGNCTPNGFSTESERFELTANWQLVHVPSSLCVTVLSDNVNVSKEARLVSLAMEKCKHDFLPQQFRHRYTLIRNGDQWPLTNAMGDLCATSDGKVSLTSKEQSSSTVTCAGASNFFFDRWALYPNTRQLRNAFGYRPWMGGRPLCLHANPKEEGASRVQ